MSDPVLGEFVAKAIIRTAENTEYKGTNVVGFGGTHYSSKHTRIGMEKRAAVGHVISRHAFEGGISDTTIGQAFDKTLMGCNTALVDWKGLNGKQRQHLLSLLEQWNVHVERC